MNLTPPQSKILAFPLRFQECSLPMPSIQKITDHCQYAADVQLETTWTHWRGAVGFHEPEAKLGHCELLIKH